MGKRRKFYDLPTRSYWASDKRSWGTPTGYLNRLDSGKRKDVDSAKGILIEALSETEKSQENPLVAIIAEHFDNSFWWSPSQIFKLAMKELLIECKVIQTGFNYQVPKTDLEKSLAERLSWTQYHLDKSCRLG